MAPIYVQILSHLQHMYKYFNLLSSYLMYNTSLELLFKYSLFLQCIWYLNKMKYIVFNENYLIELYI